MEVSRKQLQALVLLLAFFLLVVVYLQAVRKPLENGTSSNTNTRFATSDRDEATSLKVSMSLERRPTLHNIYRSVYNSNQKCRFSFTISHVWYQTPYMFHFPKLHLILSISSFPSNNFKTLQIHFEERHMG